MHQGKPDFDLDRSVHDMTTSVQHVTPDLAGATRERVMRPIVFLIFSVGVVRKEAGFPRTDSVGQTFVTKPSIFFFFDNLDITMICGEYTST